MPKEKIHYLDNEKFIEALEKHFIEKKAHPEIGCPNEIAAMFLLIAQRYVNNWPSRITFDHREDMIMKGVEYCLRYMYNYKKEESLNPFAFFTQIIKTAFQQKYNYEKRKKEIIKNVAEKMADEECFVRIKNNVKTFRPFNNPMESQVEEEIVTQEQKPIDKTIILWEDEMVVQNLNTISLDELFEDDTKEK